MANKKVERSGRERPITPTQKREAALSEPGTVNMADPVHDKGKSALADKFREREERWRREQSLQAQQVQHGRETGERSGASNRAAEGEEGIEDAREDWLQLDTGAASPTKGEKGGVL